MSFSSPASLLRRRFVAYKVAVILVTAEKVHRVRKRLSAVLNNTNGEATPHAIPGARRMYKVLHFPTSPPLKLHDKTKGKRAAIPDVYRPPLVFLRSASEEH